MRKCVYLHKFLLWFFMLNRHFLRIKVMQEVYACKQSGLTDVAAAQRNLLENIESLYELFVRQLSFWVEVRNFAEQRIEENKKKNFPTEEDLNPNMKFVNNKVLCALNENLDLAHLEEKYRIYWAEHRDNFIRAYYKKIRETEVFSAYMEKGGENTFAEDKALITSMIDEYMPDDEVLQDFFADIKPIFEDDYQAALSLLWNFFNTIPASFNEKSMLPPIYDNLNSDDSDKDFAINLLKKSLASFDENVELIAQNISNWEINRVALMDKILISMAVTELCDFSTIPVKVSINEYIDVSKLYSTPDSWRFINGLLDKLTEVLKQQGRIKKAGKGLL